MVLSSRFQPATSASGPLGSSERLLDAQQAGHTTGSARHITFHAQDAIGTKVALLANRTEEINSFQGNETDGCQDRTRVPALGVAGVRLGAQAGRPPFCSLSPIRL